MGSRLGQLLIRENMITQAQLKKAQDLSANEGGRLGYNLTKLGYLDEQQLTDFISKQYGVPSINLDDFEISPEIIKLIPRDVAEKHTVIAVNQAGSSLVVAMPDPSNIFAIDDIKFLTSFNVEVVVASENSIKEAIEHYYSIEEEEEIEEYDELMDGFDEDEIETVDFEEEEELGNIVDLENQADQAPVVKLVNLMLIDAIKKHASDIHVEVYEKYFRVRYRIDGVLYEVMKPPLKLRFAIISRLKIMSELDIAERRLPQDGRMKLKLGKGREMDFRVSTLPTIFGEKVVLRLLDKENLQLDMTKLGFDEEPLKDFQDAIHRPWGMILVTGPTGSGKTTTLYSAMTEINTPEVNISTAEDPVEFQLRGINQVHMHDDIGLNFASSLRSFLRQDPDIIMVGEIRDFETAEIAIKAALTGHVVLSTLHTNDAPSTISRLLNMGVEPFLVVASVVCVVAQRLSRRICTECKESVEVPVQSLIDAGMDPEQAEGTDAKIGKGCKYCANTGFKGRVALYEVMPFKEELKDFVLNGASAVELKREAIRLGMQTLRQSGLRKLVDGVTSIEEVLRNTSPD